MDNKQIKKTKPTQTILWFAFLLIVGMPFGLYCVLQAGQISLAWVCFGLLAAGMALVVWKG